jgi:hypothetical protein
MNLLVILFVLLASSGTPHDARHDFDFNFGTWRTHITRIAHPLSGPQTWLTYDGTVTVRPIWSGAANVEEVEAHGPGHLEFLNVRMYDPALHQWSLNGASSADGTLDEPMYGSFSNGRGVFFDQETVDGRVVLVRQTFYDITPQSYAFEQAVSDDGGSTWRADFLAHLVRISATAPSEGSSSVADTSHDFDFNYGVWSTHISTPTGRLTGTVALRKVWSGRGYLEELKAGTGRQAFQGLTLYLYDPQTREWSQTYADRSDGSFERSMIGSFTNGRGVLVSYPSQNDGTMQCVREVWSNIQPNSHHFEIQYSSDGCATWHSVFVAQLQRIGPGL